MTYHNFPYNQLIGANGSIAGQSIFSAMIHAYTASVIMPPSNIAITDCLSNRLCAPMEATNAVGSFQQA